MVGYDIWLGFEWFHSLIDAAKYEGKHRTLSGLAVIHSWTAVLREDKRDGLNCCGLYSIKNVDQVSFRAIDVRIESTWRFAGGSCCVVHGYY